MRYIFLLLLVSCNFDYKFKHLVKPSILFKQGQTVRIINYTISEKDYFNNCENEFTIDYYERIKNKLVYKLLQLCNKHYYVDTDVYVEQHLLEEIK